jgi:periplasmic divalent cation tolerance protein
MTKKNTFEIVWAYVPFPDWEAAKKVVKQLLEERIIACANLVSAESSYLWQGDFCSENEIIAVIKTSINAELTLEKRLIELHPYTIPCVARTTMRCNESYFLWVEETLKV